MELLQQLDNFQKGWDTLLMKALPQILTAIFGGRTSKTVKGGRGFNSRCYLAMPLKYFLFDLVQYNMQVNYNLVVLVYTMNEIIKCHYRFSNAFEYFY